jgi:copper chaperone NosL
MNRSTSLTSCKWLLPLLLLLLTGCAANAAEPTPPTIHYGEDVTEGCGMIISEKRFAAAYVLADGQSRIFDDIGEMTRAYLKEPPDAVAAVFVHDYETEAWMRGEAAFYMQSSSLPTPMLSGLAAFADRDKAEALALEYKGKTLTFEELLADYRSRPATPWLDNHNPNLPPSPRR